MSAANCSAPTAATPSHIQGTGMTPRWVRSDRSWRTGAGGVGRDLTSRLRLPFPVGGRESPRRRERRSESHRMAVVPDTPGARLPKRIVDVVGQGAEHLGRLADAHTGIGPSKASLVGLGTR